ncbi:MAG: leucine-rich repeat domain-containing protein, partial [Bacteroidota bacterium]
MDFKRTFLFLAIAISTLPLLAQTEDFTDLPAGTLEPTVTLSTGTWEFIEMNLETGQVNSAPNALKFGTEGSVFTPSIDGNGTISFQFAGDNAFGFSFEISKSLDGGGSYQPFTDGGGSGTAFTTFGPIALGEEPGVNVRIAITYTGGPASLIIDDIAATYVEAASSTEYFWVGEGLSSDWTDEGNWSLTSGGTGGAGVPTGTDDATFDANSFVSFGENVDITGGTVEVNDLSWVGVQNSPVFQITASGTLNVSGNFTLSPGMTFNNSGQLNLFSDAGTTLTVSTAGHLVGDIRFENPSFDDVEPLYTTWSLQDNLSGDFIVVADGANLTTQFGFVSVTASEGMSFTSFADADLGFSFIDLEGNWINQSGDISLENTTIQIDIEGTGGGSYSFDGGGDIYGTVIFSGAHDFSVSGSNIISQLIVSNLANAEFTYFDTQTINTLTAVGNATQPVGLRSDDPFSGTPIINLGSLGSASVFFAELEAIEVQGNNTPYPAFSSTDLGNNVGWSFIDFTYVEDFEANDGSWTISSDISPSWSHGFSGGKIPSSDGIWATNRSGEFNPLENSFIQSPVIDLSGTTDPTISLNLFLDMSAQANTGDSGEELFLRDVAFLEYSLNGIDWQLAGSGAESNWYNYNSTEFTFVDGPYTNDGWTFQNSDWESFSLSLPEVAGQSTVSFRLNFVTDASALIDGFEGIAIDDFFVYDLGGGADPTFDLESDSLALVALYNATDGPNWTNQTGWEIINGVGAPTPVSDWFGVTVSADRVTQLTLTANNLNGNLPAELGDLTNLNSLSLIENQLMGVIPTELGNLSSLVTLDFSGNQLTGSIPVQLGNLSSLSLFLLFDNQLSGTIPAETGNLANLTVLDLSDNQLNGSIPSELSNLTNLTSLVLANNQITSPIPTELGGLLNITTLDLSSNELTGSIPVELGNLTNLQFLYIYANQLTGSIPSELGNLTSLSSMELDQNQLTGTIPSTFSNLSNLGTLWLSDNQLGGPYPSVLGNMTSLNALLIGNNNWDSSTLADFLTLIAPLNNLSQLSVYGSNLTGPIPDALADFDQLSNIELFSNNLTGSLPAALSVLTSMTLFDLSNNNLSGSLPTYISTWSNLFNLRLNNNVFEGIVPEVYSNLTSISEFSIENNTSLCEPSSTLYTDWTNGISFYNNANTCDLQVFDLESDSLALVALYNSTDGPNWTNQTGWEIINGVGAPLPVADWFGVTVSEERLTELSLDNDGVGVTGNNLLGTLPTSLGDLTELIVLDLSENSNIFDNIPIELGNLTKLIDLQLDGNILSGTIPSEIGNLTNLSVLSLQRNELTGEIPTSLAGLTNLRILNLENNLLEGVIPTSFSNLSSLEELTLNDNQLSGSMPSELVGLSNLQFLNLSSNQLTGSIPVELGSLLNLSSIFFGNNDLSGVVPESFANLVNVLTFEINSNPGLCEPETTAYLDWVSGLDEYDNSGTCLLANTCETAEVITTAGTYTVPQAPYWYSYTAGDEDELLTISSAGASVNTDLDIYDVCGGFLISENDDIDFDGGILQSEAGVFVLANQTIVFNWVDTWSTDGFEWTLTSENIPEVLFDAVNAYSASGDQVVVRWTDLANEPGTTFTVERSVDTDDNFTELIDITIVERPWYDIPEGESTEKYFYDQNVTAGTQYFYRITGTSQANNTFISEVVSVVPVDHGFNLNVDLFESQVMNVVKGLAWGDYDADGDEDLFAGEWINSVDRTQLLENNGDDTFTNRIDDSGLPFVTGEDNVRAAAWADFNNDNELDLIASSIATPFLSIFISQGDETFEEVRINDGLSSWPIASADFNNDNLLDFATNDGVDGQLLIYLSDLNSFLTGELNHYTVTELSINSAGLWSLATGDIEGDGDVDIFVPNVGETNDQLFRNDGNGVFNEVSVPGLTDVPENHRGAQFLDVDNDGDEDIYVSSKTVDQFYINDGSGNFVVSDLGLNPLRDSEPAGYRSVALEDFDNDGDRDAILAQGDGQYWENDGGTFTLVDQIGQFEVVSRSFIFNGGASPADYNNDGFMDVAFGAEAPVLYENTRTTNNYLKVKLDSRRVNFSGVGAKIKVTGTGSGTMTRVLKGQTGAEAHTSLIKHFGLGASSTANVTVEWPDGRVSNFPAVAANQTFVVEDFDDRALDSLVMVELYMEYDGPSWPNQENWFSGTLDTWQGLTVIGDRIEEIDLSDNNISGDFTFDLSPLADLTALNLSNNDLTAIPNLASLPAISSLDITNNLLVFDDIQPTFDTGISGDLFIDPQKPFGDVQSPTLTQGQNASLTATITFAGPNETYQWYKDASLLPGETNATLSITGAEAADAGTYYVEVQNSNIPGLTLQSANINVTFSVNVPAEVAALTALYNATEGPDWDTNTGWTIEPDLDDWFGVTTNAQGQVTTLNLSDNNLVGDVPNAFANLTNATNIDLSENSITDLPDLSGITGLFNLDISDNNLLFDAIIPNADITGADYAPQKPIGEVVTFTANVVDAITISTGVDFSANGNVYTWKLDGTVVPEATSEDYAIAALLPEDAGVYTLEVTNPAAPDLTLVSAPITLEVTEFWPINVADSLMLLSVYNTLGGPSWTSSERWIDDSVTYWEGVNLFRGSVSSLVLPDNNLVGDFPALIAGSFASLDTLILSGNSLATMPTDFSNADNLRLLNLADNNLTMLPDSTGMDSLRAVVVGGNRVFYAELESFVELPTFTYLPQEPLGQDTL